MTSFNTGARSRIASLAFSSLVAIGMPIGDAHAGQQIPHSSVRPIVGTQYSSASERRWQPLLTLNRACHPYPAVDSWGNWSGGLNPSGGIDSGCSDGSKGQIYVRGHWLGTPGSGKCAVMYSWYFPKDQGGWGGVLGHRHDWEAVILWINAGGCTPTGSTGSLYAVSYSQHGHWVTRYGARGAANYSNGVSSGGHVKVVYQTGFLGAGTHAMGPTDQQGGMQALVDYGFLWQYKPDAARGLSSVNWGAANFPLKDSNFYRALGEARPSGF